MTEEEKARKAIIEEQAQQEAELQMAVWDKHMRRTFKGIVSSPRRHYNINRALTRIEDAHGS